MRELDVLKLQRFNDTHIDEPLKFSVETPDGRILDYDAIVGVAPVLTSSYDGLHNPQMVLAANSDPPIWDEHKHYPVGRFDRRHVRNLHVLAARICIEDTFGNEYPSLTIKGSNLTSPHFFESSTAARGQIIYGLQESLVVERIIRASQKLRENDISTEYICGMVLPDNFPVPDQQTGLDEVTTYDIAELLEKLATKFAADNPDPNTNALQAKSEMIEKFRDCDYIITYRAMDSPYRARDITDPDKFNKLRQFIKENYPLDIDSDFPDVCDLSRHEYVKEYFTPLLAVNVAGMHTLGLVHGFLTTGNITALGSIVDLDSCKGAPLDLGDKEITLRDKINDLLFVFRTYAELAEDLFQVPEYNAQNNQRNFVEQNTRDFLNYYIAANKMEIDDVVELLSNSLFFAAKNRTITDEVLSAITMGLMYSHSDFYEDTRPNFGRADTGILNRFNNEKIYENNPYAYLPPVFFQEEKAEILEALSEMTCDLERRDRKYRYSELILGIAKLPLRRFLEIHGEETTSGDYLKLLNNMNYYVGIRTKTQDEIESQTAVQGFISSVLAKYIEYSTVCRPSRIPANIYRKLKKSDPNLINQIGFIPVERGGEAADLPVLYLNSDQEYADILESLKVDNIGPELAGRIPNDIDLSDTFIIADYNKISEGKVYSWPDIDLAHGVILFDFLTDQRASLVISGLTSSSPRVIGLTDNHFRLEKSIKRNLLLQLDPRETGEPNKSNDSPDAHPTNKFLFLKNIKVKQE